MSKLLAISKIRLPLSCVKEVYTHLRTSGMQHLEGVALWAGVINGTTFTIHKTIVPKQTSFEMDMGLLYRVDGEELHKINVWLYKNKMTLIAQIHSHPTEAYHSETDDRYPIIAALGGISIVIPDFAFGPETLSNWAVFRLLPNKGWVELNKTIIQQFIEIQE